jgi:phosphoadenosine phosphosulfate reductase
MALLEVCASPLDPVVISTSAYADLLGRHFGGWPTLDMLDEIVNREFRRDVALVSSFGAESAVLLHLVASVQKSIPVIFIDTGKIFGSTHRYRDEIVSRLRLTDVRIARPDPAALSLHDSDSGLWLRDPDKCCAIRKVTPLSRALSGFSAWISGRKRYQGDSRAQLPLMEADGQRIKINPLVGWRKEEVTRYRDRNDLPEHPLVADGFRSIGCMPCTDRVSEGEDERSGRWRGRGKTECGIHLGLASDEIH